MPRNPKFAPHPKSVPGDFYVVDRECLACGMPHVIGPELIGWAEQKTLHCYWKKQPNTPQEMERAIRVLESQDLECLRYCGTDPTVLDRVSSSYCDYPKELEEVSGARMALEAPRFELLNDQSGFLAKILKRLSPPKER